MLSLDTARNFNNLKVLFEFPLQRMYMYIILANLVFLFGFV